MKLLKLLANLGYGSRREVAIMLSKGRVQDLEGRPLHEKSVCEYANIRVDGAALDPPPGSVVMLNKPVGYTCSTTDPNQVIYDLLPKRFPLRSPIMASVGRLDRQTSGLLLLTDDGQLLHKIISPRSLLPKRYLATLALPISGNEAEIFASGTLMLEGESTPLRPAVLEPLSANTAQITLTEGRYHQVRRMFAALGNHVETLHRESIGELTLSGLAVSATPTARLAEGDWRVLTPEERALF